MKAGVAYNHKKIAGSLIACPLFVSYIVCNSVMPEPFRNSSQTVPEHCLYET